MVQGLELRVEVCATEQAPQLCGFFPRKNDTDTHFLTGVFCAGKTPEYPWLVADFRNGSSDFGFFWSM